MTYFIMIGDGSMMFHQNMRNKWYTWFTLSLTTPNFIPKKHHKHVNQIPSNMVGWLDAYQSMNYCILKDDRSKDVEDVPFGGYLRMIFKHQSSPEL